MKKLNLIIFPLLILFAFNASFADDFSDAIIKAKKKFKEATNNNDRTTLIKLRGDFERILQLKKNEWLVNYYLAEVDMLISYTYMEKQDNDNIKKYTQSSLALLDKVTDLKDDFGEAWILKLAVNSNRWTYEFDKMNDILAKLTEAEDMAKKHDPENPRFYLVKGMNTYYTPENFGGGADKALPLFEKSVEYFKTYKIKDDTYPDWGTDMCYGMVALCKIKQDKLDEAKTWLDKGLELNPDSKFLKEDVTKEYEKKKK
jgi:tetratricopeptide (TPR) repeat protein